jgi:signal transduction histidine kinase
MPPSTSARLTITRQGMGQPVIGRVQVPRRGTGLGLSTIYTTAEHEGYGFDVESALGEGTTFKVFLPVTPARQTPSDMPAPTD